MQLQLRNIWAFPFGSGFPFQSFCSFLTKRISTSIPNANTKNKNYFVEVDSEIFNNG